MIFDFNTVGDKFYLILEGEVGVYIGIRKKGEHEAVQANRVSQVFDITQLSLKIEDLFKFQKVVTLGAGKGFGELALINNAPRKARIVAESDCKMAVMSKKDYQQALQKAE